MARVELRSVLLAATVAVGLAVPSVAQADTAVFDAKAEGMKPMALTGWSVKAAVAGSGSLAAGGGATRIAKFEDVTISKRLDENSPMLFKLTMTGAHIPTASITVTSGAKQKYMKYCFRDVMLTSYDDSHSVADAPIEKIGLNFASITVSFTPYSSTGAILTPVKFGWDVLSSLGVNYTC